MSPLERRLHRVLDHIHADPSGDLSLDTLADVAAMSRFHWHRVWRRHMGETHAAHLRRIRMHVAASLLMQRDPPDIDALAIRVGYPGRDSFARAFSAQYGMTPRQFRATSAPLQMVPNMRGLPMTYPVEIQNTPKRRLFGLSRTGPYFRIAETFDRLSATLSARGLDDALGPLIGMFHDDTSQVAEDDLRSFAARLAPSDISLPEGLEEVVLPAGPAAVLTFRGPYATLAQGYDYLFRVWLPESGRAPSGQSLYELHGNTPLDTAPEDLITEIHLPLMPT